MTADSRLLSKHEWSTCPVEKKSKKKKNKSFGIGMNRLRNLFEHVFLSALVNTLYCTVCINVPSYESVSPARSVPQCGPPCPPGAQRFVLAHSYHQEAAVFAGTVLVGSCALSQSHPDAA